MSENKGCSLRNWFCVNGLFDHNYRGFYHEWGFLCFVVMLPSPEEM
jgi:hypothetical protein